jgi:glycosyltransferase involved in cell wall biosynthesis
MNTGIQSSGAPRLSVLLPTVENRAALFAKLHAELKRQSGGRSVELIVACDSKEISIGKKRQNLLEKAMGDYVVFVDDDDFVAPTYVDDILTALVSNPDCVGFLITCTTNGRNPQKAIASMRYKKWGENQGGYAHVRSCYHKTPHKREIALKVGFRDLRYGEDKPYSEGLMQHVKTEVFIPKVLYLYRFHSEPFAAKYGITGQIERARRAGRIPQGARFDQKGRRVG